MDRIVKSVQDAQEAVKQGLAWMQLEELGWVPVDSYDPDAETAVVRIGRAEETVEGVELAMLVVRGEGEEYEPVDPPEPPPIKQPSAPEAPPDKRRRGRPKGAAKVQGPKRRRGRPSKREIEQASAKAAEPAEHDEEEEEHAGNASPSPRSSAPAPRFAEAWKQQCRETAQAALEEITQAISDLEEQAKHITEALRKVE